MINIKFEGKRPTNKEMLNTLINGFDCAKKLIENKGEGEKPNEITTVMLNVISQCVKMTAQEHNIEYLFGALASYIKLFKFKTSDKGRKIFEKSMARISERLGDEEKGQISPIQILEILINETKKVVV